MSEILENSVKCESVYCRGCLCTGRLYDMHQYELAERYLLIVGEQVCASDGLPQHLCQMCSALLLKCAAFRERCQQAKHALHLAREKHAIIQQISLPYIQTKTNLIQYPDNPELNITEVIIENKDMPTVEEPKSSTIKSENVSDILTNDISIKCEQEFIIVDLPLPLSSVTSEKIAKINSKIVRNNKTGKRLSHGEPKRKKTNEYKRKSTRKTKNNKSESILDNMEFREGEKNKKPTKFKQKGKYFETKENMANFERSYDVDIIVLSMDEQIQDILNRKHGFDYPYRCSDCFKGFMDDDNLNKHVKALHDPSRGDAVCNVCKSRYKDKRDLNRHLKTHRLKFACRQCKYTSKNTSKAVEHYKMHGGQMYKCDHCGKAYEKQSTYLTHIRIIHPSELIWCDLCGESFISDFGLNGHKKLAHKELKLPDDSKCRDCGIQFTNAGALARHTRPSGDVSCDASGDVSCDASRDATCVHCGDTFDTRLLLKDHLLEKHRNSNSKSYYPCVKCNKVFPKHNLYSAHYRRVHVDPDVANPKPIICEVCGKSLPNKCELRYHQRLHTGERPFQCPECPKSFIKRAFMKTHMRVHSNERPFACKLCPKTFKGPAALSGHQYVHTGIKPPVRRSKRPHLII